MRTIAEWRGKTDDARVPPRVRLRVFLAHEGKCYLSGRVIRPGEQWDLEHKVALCNGGEHIESNLAPALKAPHKVKTARDRKIKKRTDARRKKHIGIRKPRTITRWRKFNGTPVYAGRER